MLYYQLYLLTGYTTQDLKFLFSLYIQLLLKLVQTLIDFFEI